MSRREDAGTMKSSKPERETAKRPTRRFDPDDHAVIACPQCGFDLPNRCMARCYNCGFYVPCGSDPDQVVGPQD
jgi:hypothetical protein